MIRVISITLLCMLCMNIPFVSAATKKAKTAAPAVQKAAPEVKKETPVTAQDEFNFTDGNKYVTDEQLEKVNSRDNLDEGGSWIERIINSSHFSSDTPTKTYIPLNKVED